MKQKTDYINKNVKKYKNAKIDQNTKELAIKMHGFD